MNTSAAVLGWCVIDRMRELLCGCGYLDERSALHGWY